MVMDVLAVNVSADDERMVASGEAAGKFHAQAIGLPRGDLTGAKGLPHLISDHIITAACSASSFLVLELVKRELGISYLATALVGRNEPTVVGFFRILCVVDNFADGRANCSAIPHMQRHDASGGHATESRTGSEAGPLPSSKSDLGFFEAQPSRYHKCDPFHGHGG